MLKVIDFDGFNNTGTIFLSRSDGKILEEIDNYRCATINGKKCVQIQSSDYKYDNLAFFEYDECDVQFLISSRMDPENSYLLFKDMNEAKKINEAYIKSNWIMLNIDKLKPYSVKDQSVINNVYNSLKSI